MDPINSTSIIAGAFLSICAAVITVGNAFKTIKEFKKPYQDLKGKVFELEDNNKELYEKIKFLENKIKEYVDQRADYNLSHIKELNTDINDLKDQILRNEKDTKLILKQLLAIGQTIADPGDEIQKDKIRKVNGELIEHLIENN